MRRTFDLHAQQRSSLLALTDLVLHPRPASFDAVQGQIETLYGHYDDVGHRFAGRPCHVLTGASRFRLFS